MSEPNLTALVEQWCAERAHTYASENADHYRGFDAGRQRSAEELERVIEAMRKQLVERWNHERCECQMSHHAARMNCPSCLRCYVERWLGPSGAEGRK